MLQLPKNPNLKDFQEYVNKMEIGRWFIEDTALQKCLLLWEELWELFKSVRKTEKILKFDNINSSADEIKHEIVDMFIILCAIANRYNVNLEEAFKEKEEINKKRIWN